MTSTAKIIQFPGQQQEQTGAQRRTRRKDGLYQVKLTWRDDAGYSHQKIFYGKTQAEAQKKKRAFERDLEAGLRADDKTTVAEYAQHWLDTYKAGLRPGTLATYRKDVTLIQEAFGGKILRDVKASDIQRLLNSRAGLSASAIKKTRMTVRALFEAARRDRLLLLNPCDGLSAPEGTAGSHRALLPEEREFLTSHCRDHRFYLAAMLMLYAGLRRGEAMALRLDRDVDMEAGWIHVREAAHIAEDGLRFQVGDPKTASSVRDVPILPPLRKILSGRQLSGLALTSAKGEMCTESAFSRCWESYINHLEQALNGVSRRWANEEQLENWKTVTLQCHDLRHTFCTMMFDAGVDVKTCQKWMGHTDVMVTMRIYTHLSQAKQEAAIAAAEDYFTPGSKIGSKSESAPTEKA